MVLPIERLSKTLPQITQGQHAREIKEGFRRHLYQHGTKPFVYYSGFALSHLPLAFLMHAGVMGFALLRLPPFSTSGGKMLPALLVIAVFGTLNLVFFGIFIAQLKWTWLPTFVLMTSLLASATINSLLLDAATCYDGTSYFCTGVDREEDLHSTLCSRQGLGCFFVEN